MPAPTGNKNSQREDQPAVSWLQVRLTARRKARYVKAAKRNHPNLATWVKETLDAAAQRAGVKE